MSLYAITGLLTCVTSLIVGTFVYQRNKKNPINRSWACMSLSIGFWSFFLHFMFTSKNPLDGLIWSRTLQIGAIFIPITFFHFVLALLGLEKGKRHILRFGYSVSFFLLILNFTPLLVKSASYKYLVRCFYPDAGPMYFLYILVYFTYPGYACSLLYKFSKIVKGYKCNQIRYVLIASIIGFLGGATTFPLWYKIPIPPVGSNFVWLYALIITIAIVRYRLMDITVAVTRTSIFVAVYTLVLGTPFIFAFWSKPFLSNNFGQNWWIVPLGLMALLATTGPFIYLYIQKKAEERLLREQRRYQETLRQASAGMTRIRDLNKLLKLIVYMVTRAVKLTHACIYLFDPKTNQYSLQAHRDKAKVFVGNLDEENHLIKHLKQYREPLVYEELKRLSEDKTDISFALVETEMKKINAAVLIPSFVEDKLLGFIGMGDKISGKIFTEDDLAVFSVLANQAALAIENAQFYEEVQETHEQLFQAEKMATLGTMADGLSHQINNRFHALGLISGDALDTIKLADTASLSEETKKLILEIKHALEKVQDNVMQGGEVVKGLLKYSRPGGEGFEPITLNQIIDASLEMVQYKVKLKELDFVKDYSNDLPMIKGNFTQLQEVFFNLIDNAYDAMKQRLDELKEPGYRGKIVVTAQGFDNVLQIKLSDNGMGVKKEDFVKLFTPFFTTKASSRRGTGLGLFVIQKIISNNHKGKISVESEYKKGTTFTIELPIAK